MLEKATNDLDFLLQYFKVSTIDDKYPSQKWKLGSQILIYSEGNVRICKHESKEDRA